jgi:hypothetical protein
VCTHSGLTGCANSRIFDVRVVREQFAMKCRICTPHTAFRSALIVALSFTQPLAQDRGGRADAAQVTAGLDAMDTEGIRADVEYLACDDMGGRDTPSAGQRLAARFLRNRLERLGWKPGARDGWFHSFPLVEQRVDPALSRAEATRDGRRLELVLGRDYSFSPRALADVAASGGVTWFSGADAAEVSRAAAAVRGRWALVADPQNLEDVETELRTAGAVGVLTSVARVNGATPDGGPGVVFDLWGQLMEAPLVARPEAAPFLPRLYLPRAGLEALLALADVQAPTEGQELPIVFTETRRLAEERDLAGENVVALWPSREPPRDRQLLIVCAHYDHVGVDRDGQVFNGADDDASGCAALLALAEALAAHGPLERPVLLIWFAGEEPGLWGSEAFVKDGWYPDEARPAAVINLDMVGRNASEQVLLAPSAEHPARNPLSALAEALAPREGFTDVRSGDGYFHRSDQASFAELGIPLLFVTGEPHDDYHAPTDDAEKVDADKVRRTARLVFRILVEAQSAPWAGPH